MPVGETLRFIFCCKWASSWRMVCWFFWLCNLAMNVIFIGTTIEVFSSRFNFESVSDNDKALGAVVFVVPAVLCIGVLVHTFIVMLGRLSASRQGFHSGAVVGETFMIIFQFLTFVVWGSRWCGPDNVACDDLFTSSVVFAALSMITALLFCIFFSIMLLKGEG